MVAHSMMVASRVVTVVISTLSDEPLHDYLVIPNP